MSRVRRLVALSLFVGLVAFPTVPGRAAPKDEPPPSAGGKDPAAKDDKKDEEAEVIRLPTDDKRRKKLDAAEDYMKQESWGEAARILQSLLDAEQDSFVSRPHKDAAGKESATW